MRNRHSFISVISRVMFLNLKLSPIGNHHSVGIEGFNLKLGMRVERQHMEMVVSVVIPTYELNLEKNPRRIIFHYYLPHMLLFAGFG